VNYPASERRSFGWVYTVGAVPYHPGGFTPPLLLPTYPKVGSGATFGPLTHLIPHLKAFCLPLGSGGVFSYLPIYSTNIFVSTPSGRAVFPYHRYGVLARGFSIKKCHPDKENYKRLVKNF